MDLEQREPGKASGFDRTTQTSIQGGRMTFQNTKTVSRYAGIAWLLLLGLVIIVRAANLPLGSVQPEAVALTFMMTLPLTLGITAVVIASAAARDYYSGRRRARTNLIA